MPRQGPATREAHPGATEGEVMGHFVGDPNRFAVAGLSQMERDIEQIKRDIWEMKQVIMKLAEQNAQPKGGK